MKLILNQIDSWPKLAWVARFSENGDSVTVLHGPCFESRAYWCAEAVWAGCFDDGDFDQTDLVFGSGVRCREGRVVFVSSGSTLDRLIYHSREGIWHVSNSLPALMAVASFSIISTPGSFARDIDTIMLGLQGYKRQLPSVEGSLGVVYFNNLVWDGTTLLEIAKVDTAPTFDSYRTYRDYLQDSSELLAANMSASSRSHVVSPVATVSQGYDSTAAAAVAGYAGCSNAVTIKQSTSLWRGSDSGEKVAKALGCSCSIFDRTAEVYPFEEAVWAVSGRAGILNWALFEYPDPLTLLFTGPYGDKMWGTETWACNDPFQFTGLSVGGIGELRLFRGVFHCPVPFWGMRHLNELWEISSSDEMAPWSIGGDYDRPIPRRLAEEAGVPRELFGQLKKNTSHDETFLWPYTPSSASSYRKFLLSQGVSSGAVRNAGIRRRVVNFAHLVEGNLPRKLMSPLRNIRKAAMANSAEQIFRWANTELANVYRVPIQAPESMAANF